VNKQRNRNSEKRREARKRRKAIKRKAQLLSKSPEPILLPYPVENVSTRKLSEVVLEFAEPLTRAVEGLESEERAIRLSISLWNASLLPKQKASETITPVLDDMAKGDQAVKSEFQSMFDMMYERKQHYYPADNRFIVDYSL